MKSQDLRKVFMRMGDDGTSSVQIGKQSRNLLSQRTVKRWQNLYKETDAIDLKAPSGRPKVVRTKGLIQR